MPVVSYRYRLKDRSAKETLARHAYGVNQVFNYLNAALNILKIALSVERPAEGSR